MTACCPLCSGTSKIFYSRKTSYYLVCLICQGIFPERKSFPGPKEEKARYLQHINDVDNEGYQKFVSPIVNAVTGDFGVSHRGLDFGAGPGPVISKLLKDKGYYIAQYDPFFHYYPVLLEQRYDYIVCCEVIEHFHNPAKEFQLLKELLREKGKLYCMTGIYNDKIDFGKWYYKNDLTHVFIYQSVTIRWIKEKFKFSNVIIEGNLITFTR
jgi:SAM-dependent methyltransferase